MSAERLCRFRFLCDAPECSNEIILDVLDRPRSDGKVAPRIRYQPGQEEWGIQEEQEAATPEEENIPLKFYCPAHRGLVIS